MSTVDGCGLVVCSGAVGPNAPWVDQTGWTARSGGAGSVRSHLILGIPAVCGVLPSVPGQLRHLAPLGVGDRRNTRSGNGGWRRVAS
jgi:hypothetical protein